MTNDPRHALTLKPSQNMQSMSVSQLGQPASEEMIDFIAQLVSRIEEPSSWIEPLISSTARSLVKQKAEVAGKNIEVIKLLIDGMMKNASIINEANRKYTKLKVDVFLTNNASWLEKCLLECFRQKDEVIIGYLNDASDFEEKIQRNVRIPEEIRKRVIENKWKEVEGSIIREIEETALILAHNLRSEIVNSI